MVLQQRISRSLTFDFSRTRSGAVEAAVAVPRPALTNVAETRRQLCRRFGRIVDNRKVDNRKVATFVPS